MTKRSSIPKYKRSRPRAGTGLIGWMVRVILFALIGSLLWVLAYRFINPPLTATMVSDLVAGRGASRQWMSLDRMDRDMVRAAIGAEDSKFCQHSGFDVEAIEDAMKRNASGGHIRGGSTISQQTAKNAFLWQGGGYPRKAAEAYFTFLIEHLWGKRRIMEVYLNLAETGIGTYGANAGSLRYFGHDASAMSAIEASRIAAILPLPKKRGAIAPTGFTRRYGSSILARIGQVGRDGLDACVYRGSVAPAPKMPPKSTRPTVIPGAEYETRTPPPPEPSVDETQVDPAGTAEPLSSEPAGQVAPPPAVTEPAPTTTEPPPAETITNSG